MYSFPGIERGGASAGNDLRSAGRAVVCHPHGCFVGACRGALSHAVYLNSLAQGEYELRPAKRGRQTETTVVAIGHEAAERLVALTPHFARSACVPPLP